MSGTVFAFFRAAWGAKRAFQSQSADDLVAPSSLAERTAAWHATAQRRQLRLGFLMDVPGRPADWRRWLRGRRRENGQQVLTWTDGFVTTFPPDDNGSRVLPVLQDAAISARVA